MCTRDEGAKLNAVYQKYRNGGKVDFEDLPYLDAIADGGLIDYRYEKDGMYVVPLIPKMIDSLRS